MFKSQTFYPPIQHRNLPSVYNQAHNVHSEQEAEMRECRSSQVVYDETCLAAMSQVKVKIGISLIDLSAKNVPHAV